MKMMQIIRRMDTLRNSVRFFMGIILASVVCFTGCDTAKPASITVYNYDAYDYRVELHRANDDALVSSCRLKKFLDKVYVDSFEKLDENDYYVSIFKNNGTEESKRSEIFHIKKKSYSYVSIKADGSITVAP